MNAHRYLDTADRLLREQVPGTAGLWPRTCAWLLRLALETAVRDFWSRRRPPVRAASMHAQILSLTYRDAVDEATEARVEHLWSCLSGACHYHPYELSPTAAELRRWHEDVSAVADTLDRI